MTRKIIETSRIATPVGPFSAGVHGAATCYLSGQVAQDPATGKLIAGDTTAQTEQIFQNISAVLEAAGKSFDDVLRVGVYMTDMKDFGAMNAVYAKYFKAPYPARTAIGVAALPLGASVEVDVVVG